MSDHMLIWGGAGLYVAAMIAVGFWAQRRIHESSDFIVAGRRLPLWLATATLSATWFGGATVLGAGGTAYEQGFYGVIPDPFGAGLCLFIAGLVVVRTVRRMKLLTVSDFFRLRYGRHCDLVSSVALTLTYAGWTAAQIVVIGKVLYSLADVDPTLGMVIGAIVVVTYTYVGGMWAVTVTDFLQILILILGLLVMLPLVIAACGGISAYLDAVPDGSFNLLPPVDSGGLEWLNWFRAWIVIGLGNLAGQDLLQRSFASRDERVAQNSAYLSGVFYLTFGIIPLIVGLAATILLPDLALEDPELVIPIMARQLLPVPLMALFLGALMSAVMSSADSALLVPSSLIGQNLLRYFRPGVTQKSVLTWSQRSVPVVGLLALGIALALPRAYELLVESFALLLVVLFVPFMAGLWWKRSNTPGALSAMGVGFVTYIICKVVTGQDAGDVAAVIVAAVALVTVSLWTARAHPPRPLTDIDGNPIDLERRLGLHAAP
ncbi:MAG TPA: sodium:solute symporter family protein [Vicinamibacteria bacterium]|nr:sodium:solute symporter family protein [Vicinamibacteria bacterium]